MTWHTKEALNHRPDIMLKNRFALALMLALPLSSATAQNAFQPTPYNADVTLAKLKDKYPFITIASKEVPAEVKVVRNLTYIQRGARALDLDLYSPARAEGKVPAVVLVHGGGWASGTRDNQAPLAIRLARRGYAAATVTYRLSGEAKYPGAIHDVKAAVRYVRANAARFRLDPDRIAIAGASAGGQIASLAGVTNGVAKFDPQGGPVSSAVQAIVNIDGLSDFTTPEALKHENDPAKKPSAAGFWFGGTYAEKAALWHEASPINYAGKDTPPILFIGSGQARFAVGREEMIARLAPLGVATKVVMFPETPHSFWLFDPWLDPTVDAIAGFLDERFKTGR